MARKMISVNRELFNKLKQLLPLGVSAEASSPNRWIETTNEEKKWLKDVKFQTDSDLKFGNQKSLALASLESTNYLISIGLEIDLPQDDFDEVLVNAGAFCAAVNDLDIEPIGGEAIGLELLENIFTPAEVIGKGVSYPLEAVVKYFPQVRMFQIKTGSPLLKPEPCLFQVALFAVTRCTGLITLNWTSTGLENARAISSAQKPFLPFELVLRAIIERKNTHAFLELYRCIEFLFPFPKINELKTRLALTLSTVELSESVETILGWRPTEDSALQRLFRTLPSEIIAAFQQALLLEAYQGTSLCSKVADVLYKLRNDCVHFRPIQRMSTLQLSVKWDLLLQTMLLAISSLYASELDAIAEVSPE